MIGIYPDHVSAKAIDKEAKVDMTTSQDKAKIVALAYVKKNYPQLTPVDPSLITLDVKETGGPSGGMIFTLGVIEEVKAIIALFFGAALFAPLPFVVVMP